MKDFNILTRAYLYLIYLIGVACLTLSFINWNLNEPVLLLVLCILASLTQVLNVEGTTNRSHYSFSFIIYGFTFALLGVLDTVIVIIVSNLVEYVVKRPAWFIQIFNTACYIIVINIAGVVYGFIDSSMSLTTPLGIFAATMSMLAFTLLNHLIVGIIVWLARGEDFKKSGIFDPLPLIIDLTLLTLGTILVLVWEYSPYALILFVFPIYLIYGTMRVPALERQTELDQKTGLFNHGYFMQHLENELKRANRFDRPLTIIMADLDLLRNINNTYGHLAGDEVLIGIAKILRESVREYDVVARFGGEEFSILMPEATLTNGFERAETIRRAIEKAEFTIPTSVNPIKATISLGIANREFFNQTGKDIIHNADMALYQSKLHGRNRTYAFTQDTYLDLAPSERSQPTPVEVPQSSAPTLPEAERYEVARVQVAEKKTITVTQPEVVAAPEKKPETEKAAPTRISKVPVNLFIGGLFIGSLALFGYLYAIAPGAYRDFSIASWLGLAAMALLLVLTEMYSIYLYTKNTSLSTSAVPILAGTLLFGPVGSLILSLVYAVTISIKFRSPFSRFIFNFSNQLIAGMIYTGLIFLSGKTFFEYSVIVELIITVVSAIIVYLANTILISAGVSLDSKQPMYTFWKEQYSWLLTLYVGMGIVAEALIFGYQQDPIIGSLLVVFPLILLRVTQVQTVERTRSMVSELRMKNSDLEKHSDEITKLNDGLLDTLAEVIDLRDPYVLGHSRNVTELATKIAKRMGLHEKQIELVRKGGLLHDIGKLGISQSILSKPGSLSPEEFAEIRSHPRIGASLLEKSPHLRPLIPIVRQHHEYFNGEGYPDRLSGNHISIEARIVSVADAIEAMSTDRPYRSARSISYITNELKRCAGSQFDRLVADIAIEILNEQESEKVVNQAVERARSKNTKPTLDSPAVS